MKTITRTCVEKILEAATVELIIGEYIPLKKSGSGLKANSPFTKEKSASFMVSPAKNIWKDFSSGKGGRAINFIMEYKGMNYFDALQEAARICKIELEYEEQTEEQKLKQEDYFTKKRLIQSVSNKYEKIAEELPPEHWVRKMMSFRKWNEESILGFHLGYAPADKNYIAKEFIESGKLALAKDIGLVKIDERSQNAYDFFIDRLIFPIQNFYGEVVAFGGRVSKEGESKYAKYLNSKDSDLYQKGKILYGLYQSKKEIRKQNKAILVEGYADVISLHQGGVPITVATCGTALTSDHAKVLKRLCNHVIIWRDGDNAGFRASMKDINILLKEGFKVSILLSPDNKDPDDVAREKGNNLIEWINSTAQDALYWKAKKLKVQSETPDEISDSVQEICTTLSYIPDEIKRDNYLKSISKLIEQKQASLKKIVAEKLDSMQNPKPSVIQDESKEFINLPPGADRDQFIRDRFCEIGNTYYFQAKDGGNFFKGTNFKIQALFHIYGKIDNKRLCEVVNELGHKRLIDFESKDFINFSRIQETLVEEGFFYWEGNVTNIHFRLVTKKILNDFIMAYELKTLGWQNEGFFAFSNGIYYQNQFHRVNKYGIVQLDNLKSEDSEYRETIKHYYSPAFSEIYKSSREDDDPYENDRNFIYKISPVSMDQWMRQMVKVYGDKGIIGIGFVFASIFRDFLIRRYSFFPHLGLFGEKGSGKSKFGDSIQNFFFFKMSPFDLNSGTVVGFTRRIARVKNTATFLEEYHDKIHDIIFQSMKAAYDGRGREKGQATVDNRTSITNINSSLIYAGQYYPVRDDNSLATRSLLLSFIKEPFTTEEVENYNLLKEWEEQGLSSLILDIIRYRDIVEANFHQVYEELIKKIKADLAGHEVQERMINNYLALLTPVYILWEHFTYPFTKEYYYNLCKEMIISTSDMITESEGLSDFWSMLEYLIDEGKIREGIDYKIDTPHTVKLGVKKGGKNTTEPWINTNSDKVLYIYLKKVYQDMQRESSRRNTVLMNDITIKNYFRAKKYLIGGSVTTRLGEKSQSCYAFNYSQMHNQGILNLEKGYKANNGVLFTSDSSEKPDDFPY